MTEKLNAMMCNAPASLRAPATAEDVQKLLDAMQGMAVLLRTLNSREAGVNATVGGQDALRASGLFEDIREL